MNKKTENIKEQIICLLQSLGGTRTLMLESPEPWRNHRIAYIHWKMISALVCVRNIAILKIKNQEVNI